MKEFRWLPEEIDRMSNKKIEEIMLMLGVYNRVQNAEIERASRSAKGSSRFKK